MAAITKVTMRVTTKDIIIDTESILELPYRSMSDYRHAPIIIIFSLVTS